MPIDLKGYKVFIASPGGLEQERKAFRRVLTDYNEQEAHFRNCCLLPIGWEKTLRGMGRPQTLIGEDLKDCDYLVMVLHDRWGTPPGPDEEGHEAPSGTREEYDLALKLWADPEAPMRDILLFFKAVDDRQMSDPGPQLKQVLEFRDLIERERRLFFYTYDEIAVFEDKLRGELARWVRDHEAGTGKKKSPPPRPKRPGPGKKPSRGPKKPSILEEAVKLADEGRLTEAERLFARAVVDGKDTNAFNRYGLFLHRLGRETHAQAMFERLLEIADGAADQELTAIALGNLGLTYQTRGELDKAEEVYRKALEIDQRLGNQKGVAAHYGNLGLIHWTRRDLDKGEEMFRKALEIDQRIGNQQGMANQYGNLGLICETRGELDKAVEMHRKALEIEERLGSQAGMAADYGNLGIIYKIRGKLDEAEETHRKALEIDQRLGRQEGMAAHYGNLGIIYQTRGELDKAEEMLRKALEINQRIGKQEGMGTQYANLGAVAKQRGDLPKAREHWTKAVEIYRKIGIAHMVKKVQGWLDKLPPERK